MFFKDLSLNEEHNFKLILCIEFFFSRLDFRMDNHSQKLKKLEKSLFIEPLDKGIFFSIEFFYGLNI